MDERRLEALLENPREDLTIEIKNWLDLSNDEDKAALAQAVLALANHGGGFIILGFDEKKPLWNATPRPQGLKYDQDLVNQTVKKYADPSFHCEFAEVTQRSTNLCFPVVLVPGGHRIPIRARREMVPTKSTYSKECTT